MRSGLALLALSFQLSAQAPAPASTPKAGAFECKEDDLDSFGLTCTEKDPCPIYLELAALETVGVRVLVAGNFHAPSMTLYSILLASEDGGRTWTEPGPRIRATSLDQIQFADYENGWIGAQPLTPTPHDPLLLVSTDGGKSWQERPIFEEPGPGTLLQFSFKDKSSGSALVDRVTDSGTRHELYETQTGGMSWTLRQSGQSKITIPQHHVENADWRLRADAASKNYFVEHRVDGVWQNTASFPIEAAVCRSTEKELKEPPPSVEPEPTKGNPAMQSDGTLKITTGEGDKPKRKKKP